MIYKNNPPLRKTNKMVMKYLKRIIIYCLISFTFISCHNKVKGTGMAEKDSLPVACLSNTISRFELIEPEKTVVEKSSMREDKVVSTRDSCIDVDCLQLDFLSKERCFIKMEIFNNTNDTIFNSNNTFLYYDKETGSWSFLPYPENFVREDLGIVIAPRIKQHHTFFSQLGIRFCKENINCNYLFIQIRGKSIIMYLRCLL